MVVAPGSIHPVIALTTIFAICVGSGGAAAINMALDHDIDKIMTRTKKRPVPSGAVSMENALTFGVVLSFLSVILMSMSAGIYAAIALAFAIVFYTLIYTYILKRRTDQNIVIGGLAGAMPPLIAWLAVSQEFHIVPYILVLIIFLWTPPHFWSLALYRADDYAKANIPMLPNTKGEVATKKQIFLYSLSLFPAVLLPFFVGFSSYFYATSVSVLTLVQIIAAYKLLRDTQPQPALARKIFGFSILWLFLVFTFLVVDHLGGF